MQSRFSINPNSYGTELSDIYVQPSPASPVPNERSQRFDNVLNAIESQGFTSLGQFLVELFTLASDPDKKKKSLSISQTVSSFLNGRTGSRDDVIALVNVLYDSRFSTPRAMRKSKTPNEKKHRTAEARMARYKLKQWALGVVEETIGKEADKLASVQGGLRLPGDKMTWDFATNFSFDRVAKLMRDTSPACLRLLEAVAMPAKPPSQPDSSASPESRGATSHVSGSDLVLQDAQAGAGTLVSSQRKAVITQ